MEKQGTPTQPLCHAAKPAFAARVPRNRPSTAQPLLPDSEKLVWQAFPIVRSAISEPALVTAASSGSALAGLM